VKRGGRGKKKFPKKKPTWAEEREKRSTSFLHKQMIVATPTKIWNSHPYLKRKNTVF